MRVTAFAPYPTHGPSTWFRLAQFVRPFARSGIKLEVQPFLDETAFASVYRAGQLRRLGWLARGLGARGGQIRALRGSPPSAVIVQRELAPLGGDFLLERLREVGLPLIYDFDDAVHLRPPGGDRWRALLRDPASEVAALCRAADQVWCGNALLASVAQEARGGPENVFVVPTVVDSEAYRPRVLSPSESPAATPVVGWVGSHTSLGYLAPLWPALLEARDRVPFRVRVVCNRPPLSAPAELQVEFEPWTPERRVSALHSFDIGLYPVHDDAWARGKCGLKAIEYAACGLPVVCSPVGVLRDIVLDGRTGLHASDPAQWVDAIGALAADPAMRMGLGAAARDHVVQRYSTATVLPGALERLRALGGG